VVHLSNALLLGLAYKIKNELGIPVVCSLQDEDVWVDAMYPHYQQRVWDMMSEKAKDVDAFVAVSAFFASVMEEKMRIPAHKLHTIHVGIDPDNYRFFEPDASKPVIGFLSRMNRENGFEIFVDAFIQLRQNPKYEGVKLRVSGGSTGDDQKFIKAQIKKLKNFSLMADVDFVEDYSKKGLHSFFDGLSLLSVPVLHGEAFGLYQLEALASGIPLVQPALGAFPEIIQATGGGVVYEPNTPGALAAKWEELLSNPTMLNKMSRQGRQAISEKFDINTLTDKMVAVYNSLR
jgi:glycosyltransferase involved in cell wall biosynthesis